MIKTVGTQAVANPPPVARALHCAAYQAATGRLFVFGGAAEKRRPSDLHFLDTRDWSWHRCKTEGAGALPHVSLREGRGLRRPA